MRNKSKWHVCMKCEQFPRKVVELLRDFGHNVLTVQEAGNASLPDDNVLEFAINQNRAVLTLDRVHLIFANMSVGEKHSGSKYQITTNNLYTGMLRPLHPLQN
ncbi:MAG: DUF5615 family PIN-like protein [Microcoleaceae cyanobacterium]